MARQTRRRSRSRRSPRSRGSRTSTTRPAASPTRPSSWGETGRSSAVTAALRASPSASTRTVTRASTRPSSSPGPGPPGRTRWRWTCTQPRRSTSRIGELVGVIPRAGKEQKFRLSGTVRFGSSTSIGGATLAFFDLPTAQALFDKRGELDQIDVAAKPGISKQALIAQVQKVLPPHTQVQTGEAAGEVADGRDHLPAFVPAVLPARLRRDRAVRRRLRDREHALDHDCPAHARVRDAALRRRDRQAGAHGRRARGARHRGARIGGRAVRRSRAREGPRRALQGLRSRPPRDRARLRVADRDPVARPRHGRDDVREHPPGAPRDPGPSDLCRAGRLRAAADTARPVRPARLDHRLRHLARARVLRRVRLRPDRASPADLRHRRARHLRRRRDGRLPALARPLASPSAGRRR